MNLFNQYPDLLSRIAEDINEDLSTEDKLEELRNTFLELTHWAIREDLGREDTATSQLVIEDIAKDWIDKNINMSFTQQFESIYFNQ